MKNQLFPKPRRSGGMGRLLLELISPEEPDIFESTVALTRMAREFVDEHARDDFFLWLHYFDPHLPYTPPGNWLEETPAFPAFNGLHAIRNGDWIPSENEKATIRDLYEAEVRFVDSGIGEVLSSLREQGIYEEALIIVTSDHGEEFWDHQGFEHGHTLYRELLHVPLIIKLPRGQNPRSVADRVSLISLRATILDLCGIQAEVHGSNSRMLAPSLVSQCLGDPAVEGPAFLVASNRIGEPRIALTFDNWKYILWRTNHLEELYDLDEDPQELVSVVAKHEDALGRARILLRDYAAWCVVEKQVHGLDTAESSELDDETRSLLESLGYL